MIALQGKTDESLDLLEKAISVDSKLIEATKTEGAFENFRDFQRFKMILGY